MQLKAFILQKYILLTASHFQTCKRNKKKGEEELFHAELT